MFWMVLLLLISVISIALVIREHHCPPGLQLGSLLGVAGKCFMILQTNAYWSATPRLSIRAAHASTAIAQPHHVLVAELLVTAGRSLGPLGCWLPGLCWDIALCAGQSLGSLRLQSRRDNSDRRASQTSSNKPYAHCFMHLASCGFIVHFTDRLTECSNCI